MPKDDKAIQHRWLYHLGSRLAHRWDNTWAIVSPEALELLMLMKQCGFVEIVEKIDPRTQKKYQEAHLLLEVLDEVVYNLTEMGVVDLIILEGDFGVKGEILSDGMKKVEAPLRIIPHDQFWEEEMKREQEEGVEEDALDKEVRRILNTSMEDGDQEDYEP